MNKKTKTNAQIIAQAMRRLTRIHGEPGQMLDQIDFEKLAREFPCPVLTSVMPPHEAQYDALVEYLRQKTTARDWHAVSDAANDLRVLVAQHPELETA